MAEDVAVLIPGEVTDSVGVDVWVPTKNLLHQLNLLPTPEERAQATGGNGTFGGSPDSVAVIEAGLTAGSKWWSAGLGASVAVAWGSVTAFWNQQDAETHRVLLLGVAIATAAALLAIAFILGSDIRGRAAASVATIEARAKVADSIIRAAPLSREFHQAVKPSVEAPAGVVLALSPPLSVNNITGAAHTEPGWRAVAVRVTGEDKTYLVVKDDNHDWVSSKFIVVQP